MNIILKAAKVIDPTSPFHNQTVDIQVENGLITKIANQIENDQFEQIKYDNLHVSQGWFDSSVCLGEPGFEERENIAHGLEVAAKSGFTQIAVEPNTYPITDSQSIVSFIKQKAFGQTTEVFPIGALTVKSEGTDLAELFDMKNAGAIAFGDYKKPIQNANILKIALQYVQDFDGLIIAFSQDNSIKGKGVANEGVESTKLGLKGIPTLAEELQIARNLFLLEYTGGKVHFPTISTAKSVELIKEAKSKGLNVTCSTAVHLLTMTDEKLADFDTRFKVYPPLRDEATRQALINGVLDGTIDCITSEHNPLDIEHKKLEFNSASNGTIGLESAFAALNTVLPLEVIVDKLTSARTIFKIDTPSIKEGNKVNITLFNPSKEYSFTKENILSKSKNSAFLNHPMNGEVYGVVNGDKKTLK
ncbi:dihydroorotase [Myroides odoratimimus]|uniref:dihydroorotase n=1 Tax=Myroides odoratimimus TaxID=76832 RepID=UPI00024614C3|nr:dihydroorotase [Myroides odoratimimus]EHO09950.1 dihydroorotase, multifunctional complex type [Myroides odoratimimus CCUG 12901]MCA4806281.1 dihydroorotase [Myroides odoratimimus]MDM1095424.1 dihydroorotase [Myroides odoratimimus]MDM1399985.1 dihydroorotase [Myroides odoratimimus]MDM1411753.1 dihydroorotase [Myroides odoratimimus]